MIGKLTGVVDTFGEDWVLIDVGGVGYTVYASLRTRTSLPPHGETASLFIETHVREDAIKLFGFATLLEREWFVHLQTVQGVGARVALALLDVTTPEELELAVAAQDKHVFARATGVGPKLAGRLAAELAEKPLPHSSPLSPTPTKGVGGGEPDAPGGSVISPDANMRKDAISALVNLGYSENRARDVVTVISRKSDGTATIDDLIKQALAEITK